MEQLTDLKLPSDGKEEVAMNDDMREDLAAGDGAASVDVSESNDIEGATHTPEDMAVEDEQPEEDKYVDDPMLQTEDPEKGAEPSYKGEEAFWYVVHTYSGYENKVKNTLEMIVENRGIQDFIQDIFIPTEEVVEIKDGKKKITERKLYPGYVMIKMVLTDEIWYIVRNTRGVTGFVGPNSKPVPLSDEELAIMGMETDWVPVVDYEVGDSVKIINGPLESFVGTVESINHEKKKVRVLVSMFGRETPVDLEFTQVITI